MVVEFVNLLRPIVCLLWYAVVDDRRLQLCHGLIALDVMPWWSWDIIAQYWLECVFRLIWIIVLINNHGIAAEVSNLSTSYVSSSFDMPSIISDYLRLVLDPVLVFSLVGHQVVIVEWRQLWNIDRSTTVVASNVLQRLWLVELLRIIHSLEVLIRCLDHLQVVQVCLVCLHGVFIVIESPSCSKYIHLLLFALAEAQIGTLIDVVAHDYLIVKLLLPNSSSTCVNYVFLAAWVEDGNRLP